MSEYTTTPNLGLYKPTVDADEEMWGVHLNLNADILDGKLSEVFNVRDHDVKMDGVTDDYAAMTALAALAAATPNAVIYFPPSPTPLMLSNGIGITSNQTWWAYPGTVTIKPTAGNVGGVMLCGVANSDNIRIHGITFDGGGQDFPNVMPVTQFYHTSRLTLTQVTYQNTRGLPFNGSGINDLLIRDCNFRNIGNHWKTTGNAADYAQSITNGGYGDPAWGHRTRVEGCDFSDCGSDCINFADLTDVVISNNVFTQVLTPYMTIPSAAWFAAVFVHFCNDVVIEGNVINGMTGNAIDGPGLWTATISNNIVRNSGQGGICVFDGGGYPGYTARGTRDVTITGNVVQNSGNWVSSVFKAGIILGGSTVPANDVRITNNVSTDTRASGKTQEYGVDCEPTATGIWVDGSNYLDGNSIARTRGVPIAQEPNGQYYAPNYGGVWDATHDVGPAINAAIAAASAAGGGKVVIPAGKFGLATPILITTRGVKLEGAGCGSPRDGNPTEYFAITKLLWIGAPDATMCRVYMGATQVSWVNDVIGIVFDCDNLAAVGIRFTNVCWSTLKVGAAEPRSVGIWMDTEGTISADYPGNQHNDIWFTNRSTSATWSPTGILLDAGAADSGYNTSYNRFHELNVWVGKGDGIVFACFDNNVIYEVNTFVDPTVGAGRPVVFANSNYVMPNGLTAARAGGSYDNVVFHMGTISSILGFQTGAKIVAGVHAGTAAVNPIGLITNADTPERDITLHFAATAPVVAGMSVMVSGGGNSKIMSGSLAYSVTGTTVVLEQATIGTIPSGTAITFNFGVTGNAVPGIYTLTAVDATHWSIAAPAGGHSQTNVAVASGVLTLVDVVIPLAGVPQAGDTLILTVPFPSVNTTIHHLDVANSAPWPIIEPGATAWLGTTQYPYPTPLRGKGDIFIQGWHGASNNVTLGGINSGAIGRYCFVGAGVGSTANGFGTFVMGQNNSTNGFYNFAGGQFNLADGIASRAFGSGGTTRGRLITDVWGATSFVNQGDNQLAMQPLSAATTNATVTRLTVDRVSPTPSNTMNLPPNSTFRISLEITAHQTGGSAGTRNDSASWTATVLVKQGAAEANTAFVGGYYMAGGTLANTVMVAGTAFAPTLNDAAAAAWRITVGVDTIYGGLAVSATGEVNKNIQWLCRAQSVELAN